MLHSLSIDGIPQRNFITYKEIKTTRNLPGKYSVISMIEMVTRV